MTWREKIQNFKAGPEAVAFAAGVVVILLVTSLHGTMLGLDGFYHVRMAELYANGAISEAGEHFHWTQHSLWNGNFSDKDWLWHILMIPLVWIFGHSQEGLITVGNTGAALAAGMVMAVVVRILRRRGSSWPLLWGFVLLAASTTFIYRLGLPRSYLLSISLAVLGWHWIEGKQRIKLAALAFIYTLSYTAPHVLFVLAGVWAFLELATQGYKGTSFVRKLRHILPPFIAITIGIGLGLLAHPESGNLVRLWVVQNLMVPAHASGLTNLANSLAEMVGFELPAHAGGVADIGKEMLATDGRTLFKSEWGGLLLLIMPWVYASLRRVRPRVVDANLWAVAGLFFVMMLNSTRFAEYFYPFVVIAAALLIEHVNRNAEEPTPLWAKRLAKAPIYASALVGVLLLGRTLILVQVLEDRDLSLGKALVAIGEEVPDGEAVFHSDWGDFTQLFYAQPDKDYLIGLDPTFFFVKDHRRYQLFEGLKRGEVPKSVMVDQVIRDDFGMRFAFVRAHHSALKLLLQRASFRTGSPVRLVASDEERGWWLYDLGAAAS